MGFVTLFEKHKNITTSTLFLGHLDPLTHLIVKGPF